MNRSLTKAFLIFLTMMGLSLPVVAEPLQFETQAGQTIPFDVEIADTPEKHETGMMNRDSLKPNTGMLFVFDKPQRPQFWMKNTKIRLDLIYIGADGIVNHIHENAIPFDLTPISCPERVKAVLETSGGAAKKLGITKGDKVIAKIFEKETK